MPPPPAAPAPRFSLIIPAFNEAALLPRLLDSVDAARARYAGGPGAVEVLVADNASTDATGVIARSRGCGVVRVERRTIGAARNGGARASRGEALAFVDADSRIHPETLNALDRALGSGRFVGGATGVRMERMSPGIALTLLLFLPLVWATGMDTGVVFCRREDFDAVGGYEADRLFGEDVVFLFRLARRGRRTGGRRLTRLREAKAVASTRKFDRFGDWHYFPLIVRMALRLFSPRALAAVARGYWYEPDR